MCEEHGTSQIDSGGVNVYADCVFLAALALLLFACPLSAPAYTALVGFGDSYVDTGNFPSSPPDYWNGRFSNGPLWIEDLSQTLGFAYNPANNFAVSGSESDELGLAIAKFPGTSDSSHVLFAIWSGNNDFANHLSLGADDAAWDTRINGVVSSLVTASGLLYQKGARNLILFNLMDITRCPDIQSGYSASFRSYIAGKVQIFNSRLAAALPNLLNAHPGLQVYLVDTYSDFNYLLDSYASLGFTKATVGALNDPNLSDKSFDGAGANYVFWDSQHPTAKAHALIAQWVANLLPPPPPPTVAITVPQSGAQFAAPTSISVNAAVVPNGWNIDQVAFLENGALLGQVAIPPYVLTVPLNNAGAFSLTARVTYGSGQTASSSPVQVTVMPPPGSAPPAPWSQQDIGGVGKPGTAFYASNGIFTVSGSGSDIWAATDAFHYLYQSLAGDGTIIASVIGVQDTDGYAKAGLMFRDTLAPEARNAMVFMTPTSGAGFQSRVTTGGNSSYNAGPSVATPYWLKLERLGSRFSGYGSPDGSNWLFLGTVSISMPTTVYVGLAVTSHNNSLLNSAAFGNVVLTQPPRPLPPVLSLRSSATGVLQLTVSGATGATYICEASTNLVDWTVISTNLTTAGSFQIQPQTPLRILSLYRALLSAP
jgi:phospholipase/lecithinase/hemolysin